MIPPSVSTSSTQRPYSDYGISAEQISQLKEFIGDAEVSYVDDSGQKVTTTGASLLDEPTLDADQALALLQAMSAKLKGANIESATESIQLNKEKQEKLQEERMAKMTESIEAADKAKKSGEIGQVFAWIGVGLAIIAAAAATVLTFGAAAPASALMVAGCIAAVTGAVLGTTTQIVSSIPGAMEGMGTEGAKAFMYTMMALQIGCALISLGTGIGSAINASKATADVVQETTKLIRVTTAINELNKVASGATSVAGGAAGVATAYQKHDAEYIRAELQEISKFLKSIQAQDEKEIEFIKTMQQMVDNAWQIVAGTATEVQNAREAVVQTTSI
jgi:hypothetical protein